jgi:hypothetical protein
VCAARYARICAYLLIELLQVLLLFFLVSLNTFAKKYTHTHTFRFSPLYSVLYPFTSVLIFFQEKKNTYLIPIQEVMMMMMKKQTKKTTCSSSFMQSHLTYTYLYMCVYVYAWERERERARGWEG